ncbi:MAG: GIY-YIG nuclease family protein [Eubacteriales bacterium]
MFYVYMLRCADGSLYTGWTTDIARRLKQHNKGAASKYTRVRLPVALVYSEVLSSKQEALKREYEIKQYKKKRKEDLINKKQE